VFSTVFTADARFVLSGSDDGNVRIWKAKASDKLGVIDARERAAMEYRDTLKQRWKMDAEVGKVSRCVLSVQQWVLAVDLLSLVGADIFRSQFIKPLSSNVLCWMPEESRRREDENTPELEKTSQRLRKRRWWSKNRLRISPLLGSAQTTLMRIHRSLYDDDILFLASLYIRLARCITHADTQLL
jgi:hypothetical protein